MAASGCRLKVIDYLSWLKFWPLENYTCEHPTFNSLIAIKKADDLGFYECLIISIFRTV